VCGLTLEFTRLRKAAKPPVAGRVQRPVRRLDANLRVRYAPSDKKRVHRSGIASVASKVAAILWCCALRHTRNKEADDYYDEDPQRCRNGPLYWAVPGPHIAVNQ